MGRDFGGFFSHNLVGSTPVERTKMSGVLLVESSKTCTKSKTGGSTNLDPGDIHIGNW